ncbi:SAM-dependent methyltransferase [Nocardioides daedukensis]|uniref:SAM-dependent methyltransferase n=1 Tax=Nocardioides daedukensis TaxID=634462 RepID=A0A7Y9RYC5_9ACTN|nr:class I SAM-dependent methyltransferase [Nocardioides daedukensis]NYG57661.1 SAM-dependent methyltransferase [Nocardioides daedukensis]
MGYWTDRVVPRLTDVALSSQKISDLRARACAGLSGRVLEIGFGSGLNLPHLPAAVTGLEAVEPSELGWSRSEVRRTASAVPVSRVGLDGQSIASSQTYDSALVTFTLCTVPDAERALAEIVRLLRPGGRLHFLEHGLSPDDGVARWQRRLNGIQGLACGGCQLTKDVPRLVEAAGLDIVTLEARYLQPGPAPTRAWSYGFLGAAERPSAR